MDINIHVHHHNDPEVRQQLGRVEQSLSAVSTGVRSMATIIEEMDTKVTGLEGVVGSIVTILHELKAALDTAILNGNMQALSAISARVGVLYESLVAAGSAVDITPETPVVPPVAPPPVEPPPVEPPPA